MVAHLSLGYAPRTLEKLRQGAVSSPSGASRSDGADVVDAATLKDDGSTASKYGFPTAMPPPPSCRHMPDGRSPRFMAIIIDELDRD